MEIKSITVPLVFTVDPNAQQAEGQLTVQAGFRRRPFWGLITAGIWGTIAVTAVVACLLFIQQWILALVVGSVWAFDCLAIVGWIAVQDHYDAKAQKRIREEVRGKLNA